MTSLRGLYLVSVVIAGAVQCGLSGCTGEEVIGGILGLGSAICETDGRCDDGLFCNGEERCGGGFCENGVVPCGAGACDENTNTCSAACTSETCDDGAFCNGQETCSFTNDAANGECVSGDVPCLAGEICLEDDDRCVECTARENCASGQLCIDELCIDAPTEPESFTVILLNEDILTTHLLTAAEDFGAANRLAPGASRTFGMPPSLAGDVFTFRAGRNGVAFATVDCEFFPEPLEDAVVTWTGFALTCGGDLTTR